MNRIAEYLAASRDALEAARRDDTLLAAIAAAAELVARALRAGNKVLAAGNGGSAADAQHIAGELLSRFSYDRAPLAAIALTTDSSVLTAIGNDYGYEHVFERQVRGLGRGNDVLIALSTSGRSKNVLWAMDAARDLGMHVIAFTGRDGGDMPQRADIVLRVSSDSTPIIQQVHGAAAHIVCALVEESLFPPK